MPLSCTSAPLPPASSASPVLVDAALPIDGLAGMQHLLTVSDRLVVEIGAGISPKTAAVLIV